MDIRFLLFFIQIVYQFVYYCTHDSLKEELGVEVFHKPVVKIHHAPALKCLQERKGIEVQPEEDEATQVEDQEESARTTAPAAPVAPAQAPCVAPPPAQYAAPPPAPHASPPPTRRAAPWPLPPEGQQGITAPRPNLTVKKHPLDPTEFNPACGIAPWFSQISSKFPQNVRMIYKFKVLSRHTH